MNDTVVDSHQALSLCASSGITLLEAYSFKMAAVQYDVHDGASGDKAEKSSVASCRHTKCRVKSEDLQSAGDVQCELYNSFVLEEFCKNTIFYLLIAMATGKIGVMTNRDFYIVKYKFMVFNLALRDDYPRPATTRGMAINR